MRETVIVVEKAPARGSNRRAIQGREGECTTLLVIVMGIFFLGGVRVACLPWLFWSLLVRVSCASSTVESGRLVWLSAWFLRPLRSNFPHDGRRRIMMTCHDTHPSADTCATSKYRFDTIRSSSIDLHRSPHQSRMTFRAARATVPTSPTRTRVRPSRNGRPVTQNT